MKIHIFFCETSNDGTVGGSHTCMYNLIRYSDRERLRFTVGFFVENQFVQKYRDLGVDVVIMPFVPPIKEGIFITRKAINWYNIEYKIEKYLFSFFIQKKFDVLLMNNTVFESISFIKVAKKLGLPVVVYERGWLNYTGKHIRSSKWIDASIAVSDIILKNMYKNNFKSKLIKLIYDGIDPASFEGPFDKVAIQKELKIPCGSKVIGIIGNVRSWKGQKYFIEALILLSQKYPDLYGLIIGGWSEIDHEYLKTLRQVVKDEGLEEKIKFLGYRQDTPALLSILDVFVHASTLPEPFGMVLLEAMAARVPIIATNFGGPVEILDAGNCGVLVPPRDGKSIAEECIKFFSDEKYRINIIEQAHRRLCDKFHISNTVNNVEQLLEIVLQKYRSTMQQAKTS